jgi:ABC-type siderophore export system fused ATPase/permease subunit
VVSHDERFLDAVGVDRWLRLNDGRLAEVAAPGVA